MDSSSWYGAVPIYHIWTMPREFCGRRSSFFSAVILLVAAAIGSPAHAQTVTATVPVGSDPIGIAVNPVTNKIYVTNQDQGLSAIGTVTVIDGATNATTTVTVGIAPQPIAVNSATNTIYVANQNYPSSGTVTVINGATNSATATVPVGPNPRVLAVNSATNKIYVVNSGNDTVTVIDGVTNSATATVNVGSNPEAIAVDSVTNTIYVGNYGDTTVTAIDGATNVTSTVNVGPNPGAIAVNSVTNKIYVANGDNTVTVIEGVTATATVPVGTNPGDIEVNSVTDQIYVANGGGNTVTVIDGATNATTTVPVGPKPVAIAVNSVTNTIYVINEGDGTVTVIDRATDVTTIVTPSPGAVAIAVNPVTNTVYVVTISKKVTVIGASGGSNGSSRLINISTRAVVGTGGNILIPGFVIGGSGAETLLIRADGPSLTQFGVGGALAVPSLSVFDSSGTVIATNTGWTTNTNPAQISSVASQVGAFAFAAGSADCALIANLPAGAYTVQVSGVNNTSGVALAEVYEVSSSGTRLINISTRAQVGTGANIIIPGFVISGSGTEQLLVRADGPSLTQFGVGGALAMPSLSVFNSSGTVIASNTVWGTSSNPALIASTAAFVGAFAFTSGSADSAQIVNLPAGAYTIQVSGVSNTTGVALAEVYEVP